MDARVTKQRLGNMLSYDWLKILCAIAAAVVNAEGRRYFDENAKTTLYFGTSQPDELSEKLTGKKCVKVEL